MPKRKRFQSGTYYHICNRGRYHTKLFHEKKDYERFLWYVSKHEKNYRDDLKIIAYSVIPNHFHFVLRSRFAGYRLSYFMGTISGAYAKYYKAKYGGEKGVALFEGRFYSAEIYDENYLNKCIRYVERNAVKHKIVDDPKYWFYSSYKEGKNSYIGMEGVLDYEWEFDK